jgi:hypothetical protein
MTRGSGQGGMHSHRAEAVERMSVSLHWYGRHPVGDARAHQAAVGAPASDVRART